MGEIHCRCPKGHGYMASEEYIKNGGTCPVCLMAKGKRVIQGYNDIRTLYPELSKELHWSADENKVVKLSNKYKWKCTKCGHLWEAKLGDRLNGKNCPNCKKLMAKSKKSTPSYEVIDW